MLADHNEKSFLYRIDTGDEKWIHYDNPQKGKLWGPPVHASRSTTKPNTHGRKPMLFSCYELLKPVETLTGAPYRIKLMKLIRSLKEKGVRYSTASYEADQKILGNVEMESPITLAVFAKHCPF